MNLVEMKIKQSILTTKQSSLDAEIQAHRSEKERFCELFIFSCYSEMKLQHNKQYCTCCTNDNIMQAVGGSRYTYRMKGW